MACGLASTHNTSTSSRCGGAYQPVAGGCAMTWRNFPNRARCSGGSLARTSSMLPKSCCARYGIQLRDHVAPRLFAVHAGFQFKSKANRGWSGLDELAAVHPGRLVDDGADGKGRIFTVRPSAALSRRTSSCRPATRIAGSGLPHGHESGRTSTESPRSYRMSGWIRLARFVEHGVRWFPGGVGWKSSSTGSRITQSLFTCNDQLRKRLIGQAIITPGIAALGPEAVERLVITIAVFDDFCTANDPHVEHDFGCFKFDDVDVVFKIDYFDKSLKIPLAKPSRSIGNRASDHHYEGRRILDLVGSCGLRTKALGLASPDRSCRKSSAKSTEKLRTTVHHTF